MIRNHFFVPLSWSTNFSFIFLDKSIQPGQVLSSCKSVMCVYMYMCVSDAWRTHPALTKFSVFKGAHTVIKYCILALLPPKTRLYVSKGQDMKWDEQNDLASDVQKRQRQRWQVLRVTNHKHTWLTVWRIDQACHRCKRRKSVRFVGQGMVTHTLIRAHVRLGQNDELEARLGHVACSRLAWASQKRPLCLLLRLRV